MNRISIVILLCLTCLLTLAHGVTAAEHSATQSAEVTIDAQKISIEGGVNAPATQVPVDVTYMDKKFKAIRLTLQQRDKAYNALRFPLDQPTDVNKYNTLKFKIHFASADGKPYSFGVRPADAKGSWNGTSLTKHLSKISDGWYQFSWDIVNQPDNVRGMDLTQVVRVGILPTFDSLPKDKPLEVVIFDMQLVSGESVATGDPVLYAKWQSYISAYKPDYTDSTRMMLPPVEGRISQPIKLVAAEKSQAVIVLSKDAADPMKLAGNELQRWISAITGANLPITDNAPSTSPQVIFLGSGFAQDHYKADLEYLKGTDGYAVRSDGNRIYIFGATDKGTLNGVFAFLENNTDLIWPRPRDELGAVYSRQPNLDIVWADQRVRPATRLRGWATNSGQRPAHEVWSVRNGNNYPTGGGTDKDGAARRRAQGGYVEFGGGHNLHAFIDKDQTQFYPIIDGKKPEKLNVWKHQLCFTHPDLPAVYTANLLKYIREKVPADADCVNVKIEDNRGVCTCDRCMAPITLPNDQVLKNTDGAFRSTQFFQFLNKVTDGVRQEYPNLYIGTYAYFFTSTPPAIAVNDHIQIYFCPYIRKDHRSPLSSPINDHWWIQLTNWANKSPNVVIREYYGIMNGFRPLAEVVAFDVKSYIDRGVMQYTSELNPDETFIDSEGHIRGGGMEWDFMATDFWVINRIYWNPNQDVEQLRKYYIRRTYREAAPNIERFFGAIRTAWYAGQVPSDFEEAYTLANGLIIRANREDELRGYLAAAAAQVKHPIAKMHVDVLQNAFETALTWAQDPESRKAYSKTNPAIALRLGWGPSNEWKSTQPVWTQATVISDNGKTIPAVRVSVRTPAEGQMTDSVTINNPWLNKLSWGDTVELTLRPEPGAQALDAQAFRINVQDLNNTRITAPAGAFEAGPDGSVRLRWRLEKPEKQARPFDLEKIRRIYLELPVSKNSTQEPRRYYLTDLLLRPAPASAF